MVNAELDMTEATEGTHTGSTQHGFPLSRSRCAFCLVLLLDRISYTVFARLSIFSVVLVRLKSEKRKSENISRSVVSGFATPWTVAHQAPLSMEVSRQEYWRG